MHADPLSAYAYRLLGGMASIETIDRWFAWFWNHLRGLDRLFDLVVCANDQLSARLRDQGLAKVQTIRMGVEAGVFSPLRRSASLRSELRAHLGLAPDGLLLIGAGRFAAEKRWEMVIRAVREAGRKTPAGLVLVGDGARRAKLELLAERSGIAVVLPRVNDRAELARLFASADALVHGCEAETFCMVAAEARASGLPLIVPDRGAALDQLVPGAGAVYASGDQRSLTAAIERFAANGRELQRARAAQNSLTPTMDQHFERLFGAYGRLGRTSREVGASMAEATAALGGMLSNGLAASAGQSV